MRAPTAKRLCATFDIDRKQANLIRKLAKACDSGEKLESLIAKHCPSTDAYARSCHHWPFSSHMWRVTMVLHAIDAIIGTYGVEGLGRGSFRVGPPYEYCNAGDPYATTLIYKRATDNLYIGCWGTIAERLPKGENDE